MTDFIKGTRHFGIVVRNLKTSIAFYEDLGLKITKQMDESGEHIDKMLSLTDVNVTTVKMSAPKTDTLIELLHYKNPIPKEIERKINDLGPSHLAFTVKNLSENYKNLLQKGIEFFSEPQLSSDKRVLVVFCNDPNGIPIELVEQLDSK